MTGVATDSDSRDHTFKSQVKRQQRQRLKAETDYSVRTAVFLTRID